MIPCSGDEVSCHLCSTPYRADVSVATQLLVCGLEQSTGAEWTPTPCAFLDLKAEEFTATRELAGSTSDPRTGRIVAILSHKLMTISKAGSVDNSDVQRAQATGIEFPDVADFWQGESCRSLGAGLRSKKFAFVPVKVDTSPDACSSCASAGILLW